MQYNIKGTCRENMAVMREGIGDVDFAKIVTKIGIHALSHLNVRVHSVELGGELVATHCSQFRYRQLL